MASEALSIVIVSSIVSSIRIRIPRETLVSYSNQGWAQQPQQPQQPGQPPHPTPPPTANTSIDLEIKNRRLRTYDRVKAGEQTTTIRQADPNHPGANRPQGNPLAYVHVPQDVPKGGRTARPPFTVTGLNGELLCSVRSVGGGGGGGTYDVYGGDGAVIGRITRHGGRLLPAPRRVRWTMGSAHGGEPPAGKVGTVKGWVAWTILGLPLYGVAWAIGAAQGLLLLLIGDKEEAKKESVWDLEPPNSTEWRASADPAVVLEYRGGGIYRLTPSRLDHRLAYAQAVLHIWDRGTL
ncbi:hypothetical protein [Streptomyces poonensis]|uniref:Uncharacterized protein n=1 Tax=Streptomyces poonensis TaxID=68255 RepID=A0A918Q9Q7_9ACTN|nr:hypothetical protein [Streptomyces poonensis]GGZ39196.1 hypothetical protein GCM10010365_69930 [Streptomyces poonensis]GLJ93115.1 hypothetical protein GCM10017589_57270 [Streptomyces poonensis]